MRLLHTYSIVVFLTLFLMSSANSQEKLDHLNKLAFKSLEEHSKKSEEYANQILKITKGNDSSVYSINAYTILGILNKDKGYYVSSLNYYLKALNASEKKKDLGRVSASMNNIGVLYRLQGDLKLAIDYFSKSLKIEEKLKQPLQKSIRFYNIGDCYKELDSFDLALSFFSNSLIIEQKNKKVEGEIYAFLGIAEVYLEIGQTVDAKRILDRIKNKLKESFVEESILYYKLLGKYLFKQNDTKKALEILLKAEELSEKNNFPIHLLEIHKIEIDILEKLNSWVLVSSKYKEYTALSEKLIAIEIRNKVHDLMYSNELHKKELEITLIEEDRDFAEKLNSYNSKVTWFLIVILVFVIGFVFYGINKNKN
jgi:tetratricopeptide (TPR) repeat protein